MKIEKHIFDLLFQHDCVVLPGFGGFVANYVSAKLDDQVHRMHPPTKKVLFNKYLINNDGLLAHRLAETEGIAYDEALEAIEKYVADVKASLKSSKRFEINQVGVFFVDASNNTRFRAAGTNFLMNSFGLPVVKAIPVAQPIIEEVKEVQEKPVIKVKPIEVVHDEAKKLPLEPEEKIIPIEGRRKRGYWKVASVAAAVVCLGFYSAWIPMKTDLLSGGGNFQYSDLNPFTYNKQSVYEKQNFNYPTEEVEEHVTDYKIYPEDLQPDPIILEEVNTAPDEVTDAIAETTYVEKEVIEVEETHDLPAYYIVGGCFGKYKNATNLVKSLKDQGYEALIIDQKDDLHRVGVGKFSSRDEAKLAKKDMEKNGISGWILKK